MTGENSLADWMYRTWKSFGNGDAKTITVTPIPKLSVTGATLVEYVRAVERMNQAGRQFEAAERSVVETVTTDVEKLRKTGRDGIVALIETMLNNAVAAVDETSFVRAISESFSGGEGFLKEMIAEYRLTAGNIDGQRPGTGDSGKGLTPEQLSAALEAAMKDFRRDPGPVDGSTTPGGPAANPGGDSAARQALQDLMRNGSGAASGLGGGGMDLMSSLLPSLMQQAMMRNLSDREIDSRRGELKPDRIDQQARPADPPAVTAPLVTGPGTPWSGQQPAAAAPASPAPANATANAAPAGAQPAARVADADGGVLYTFPDGRTQRVSQLVAQALDVAFGNAAGTDAQAAYANTAAKWDKAEQGRIERPGEPVDPYELMTGDVAVWNERSAIVVVFGDDSNGSLEIVTDGALQPFAAEMHDGDGDFGEFAGFSHPSGIEISGGAGPVAGAGAPPADQSAPAAPAVVTA